MSEAAMCADLSTVHTLLPGEVACAGRGERLQTLLGSCVSVVMTDRRRTVGAMCHIVHAGSGHGGIDRAAALETAWGGPAMDAMHALLIRRGYQPHLCEAWVYGGGNMFPGQPARRSVGDANADWVIERLHRDGIHVSHVDVGGSGYRKLDWTVGPQAVQVQLVPMESGAMRQAGCWRSAGEHQGIRGR